MRTKLAEAQALHNQGQLDNAWQLYEEILKEEPKQPEILHLAAILHAQKQDYQHALGFIDQAISIDPETANYYNSKGILLSKLGKTKDACHAYQEAITHQSNYAIAYNNLANAYHHLKQMDQAETAYKQAITFNPQYADALYNLGRLHLEQEKWDEGTILLKKTLKVAPKHARALGQLGRVYLQNKAYTQAIEQFKERLIEQPYHAATHQDIALAYIQLNDISQACEHLQKAVQIDPELPEVHFHLATTYLQKNDQDNALKHYLRHLETEPNQIALYNVGVILSYKDRHKDAISYLERALDLNPDYLAAHLNIAAIYQKINQTKKAITHYQRALALNPNDDELKHILTALQQKETPEAAPLSYITHLFDQYAPHYEKHLTDHLKYQVPQKLKTMVDTYTSISNSSWRVMDLGCGTGLSGDAFCYLADELIGIDISAQMIAEAKKKNIYQSLEVIDIDNALDKYNDIDLLIAADVFAYIGDLKTIMQKAKSTVKRGGYFAFSVEKTLENDYILQKTVRYAHNKHYLEKLFQDTDWHVVACENTILRKHRDTTIEGYQILLQNPSQ